MRLVLGGLVVATLSACGSVVAAETPGSMRAAGHPGSAQATVDPGPQPGAQQDPGPADGPPAHGDVALPTTAPATPEAEVTPTKKPSPPPAKSSPPQSDSCDWHANLERAKAERPIDWIVLDTGAWGRAEVPGNRIWIAPRTPCDKVYSVAVHEWTHHMQGVVYGDWGAAMRELAPYGGPEVVADCGALLLGATWTNYGCRSRLAREAAVAILSGERP